MSSGYRWFLVVENALPLLHNAQRLKAGFAAPATMHSIPCWEPAVDLYEHAGELRLLVALPGVTDDEVEVVVEAGAVLVRGKRSLPPVLQRAAIHRLEIPYGRFERRVLLPPGNFSLRGQCFEGGCLVLLFQQS